MECYINKINSGNKYLGQFLNKFIKILEFKHRNVNVNNNYIQIECEYESLGDI